MALHQLIQRLLLIGVKLGTPPAPSPPQAPQRLLPLIESLAAALPPGLVVVADTADNAGTAMANLKPPPGGPELISSAVYEVGAEA